MINDALKEALENLLSTPIIKYQAVGGGSINQTGKIHTSEGKFFVKINEASAFPDMFKLEAEGLETLRKTDTIRIPEVIRVGEVDDQAFLMMEYIEPGVNHGFFWESFGIKLAALHQCKAEKWGFEKNNYIGSLPQSNKLHDNFVEFFVSERIQPHLKMAIDAGKMEASIVPKFETMFAQLPDIIPEEKPTLIHGDLWSGNYLADDKNQPVLIDPAVAYSHREMELAMTVLFGGFPEFFYEVYDEAYPTAPGLETRIEIYQLYYLLTHVNLFGGAYVRAVKNIVSQF